MANGSQKILFLESLRGIAAISVAFHHANFAQRSALVDNMFIKNSFHMVDFFFVLSGYVIAMNYLDRIDSLGSLLQFQTKRFLRLYPLHFLTLIVFALIELSKCLFQMKTGIIANSPPFATNDLGAFINNLFLTHSMLESQLTFNSVSWSISTEFYTYLIFAVMLATVRGRLWKYGAIAGVIAGAGAYLFFLQNGNETAANGSAAIARCLYAFFLGVGIYLIGRIAMKTIPRSVGIGLFAASVLTVCYHEQVPALLIPVLFAASLYALIHSDDSAFKKVLSHRGLVFLGTISYGIYMWHLMVWWVIDQLFRFVLKYPTITDQFGTHPDISADVSTIAAIVGIAVVLVLSWFSYRFVERPFNGLRHYISKPSIKLETDPGCRRLHS